MAKKKKETQVENNVHEQTEQEIKDIADVLNSWSPIIYVRTVDQDTLFTDISNAVKRINRTTNSDNRTRLLYFNMATGLSEVYIYSDSEMEKQEVKVEAPNGLRLKPMKTSSQAVTGREVDWKLDGLLAAYSKFDPGESGNSPFQSTILMLCDVNNELNNNTTIKHSLLHFLRQTEVFYNRHLVNRQVLIISGDINIPHELERSNVLYTHGGYTSAKMIDSLVPDPEHAEDDEIVIAEKIANAMAGLTLAESQSVLNMMANRKPEGESKKELALVDLNEKDINFITHKRKEIVNRNKLLEIKDPHVSIDDIGGNDRLKEFVTELKTIHERAYEARKFGVTSQRGILLLGPPGTGKSTICEMVANTLSCPYMKLDLSKIMESRVGSSEGNIKRAMDMAEKIGGVLQIDEVEKTLGGVESSNKVDGGITLRIFSTILETMARKNDVIFIATANDIQGLPPEFSRKGRIDELYLVDYPVEEEIGEIMDVHIRKSGRNMNDIITPQQETKLCKALKSYTGSEIEYVVNKALKQAFLQQKDLTADLIHDIIREMIPMSKTYATELDRIRQWAVTVAEPSSSNSEFAKLRKKQTQEQAKKASSK